MKQLRWKDFSLVSKIVIEVGMIAEVGGTPLHSLKPR